MFSLIAALIATTNVALAGNMPAVSPRFGIVGVQIWRNAICKTYESRPCLEIINRQDTAVSFQFSYPGAPAGFPQALVTEAGATQCILIRGNHKCVAVLGPHEHGWIMFSKLQVIGVEITEWSMPGLEEETQSLTIPGTAVPMTLLGEYSLYLQGTVPEEVAHRSCDVDLRVSGANTLFVGMCKLVD